MKSRLFSVIIFIFCFIMMGHTCFAALNNLIPSSNSDFYYKLGGGANIPMPAYYDTTYIPLNAEGDVGLGFDCGAFNPAASFTNELNQIQSSMIAVKGQVVQAATGAITELPLYELSRADPSLYNLITNAMAGIQKDLGLSTKSCEAIQSQIASGENPYSHLMTVSMGNSWRKQIGSAMFSGNGDIIQARNNVSQDAGKNGLPWVSTSSATTLNQTNDNNSYAGGIGQPAIHVIRDTVKTGYQLMTEDAVSKNRQQFSNSNDDKPELTQTWSSSEKAAEWITNVVGDQILTTYNGGDKKSQPGTGLYPDIQYQMNDIKPKLTALIDNPNPLKELKDLQAISPQGIGITPEMINTIKKQPTLLQAIIIDKLSQSIAALNVIEKARLASRLLQTGLQEPAIYSNPTAKKIIQDAMNQLQQDVSQLLFYVKAKQQLASNVMATISQAGQAQTLQNTAISMPNKNQPVMEQGAIKK